MSCVIILAASAGAAVTLAALVVAGWHWWAKAWEPLWLDDDRGGRP